MPDHGHIPVLFEPVLRELAPQPGQVALDCTLGRGGHAEAMLEAIAPGGTLVGVDLDPENLEYSRARLEEPAAAGGVRLELHHRSFRDTPALLRDLELPGVDCLLADLGFASNQVDQSERGLAFSGDGPLDMRLNPNAGPTAADLIAGLPEKELADVIYQYGEERLSRKIARLIVAERDRTPITTTRRLAELVRRAYGPSRHRSRIDPATRTFQALRIAVNGELDALTDLLDSLSSLLLPAGRAAIISFHSLEDRLVKHRFAELEQLGHAKRLCRKPIVADEAEVATNPRARSAKMRVLQYGRAG